MHLTRYCASVALSTFLMKIAHDGKDLRHMAIYAIVMVTLYIAVDSHKWRCPQQDRPICRKGRPEAHLCNTSVFAKPCFLEFARARVCCGHRQVRVEHQSDTLWNPVLHGADGGENSTEPKIRVVQPDGRAQAS